MLFGFIIQATLVVLAGMILDGGYVAHTVIVSVVAFWPSVFLLVLRNPKEPKPADLVYIKFGPIPVAIISFFLTSWIWQLREVM